jgi:predicted metal-binding membrane protein
MSLRDATERAPGPLATVPLGVLAASALAWVVLLVGATWGGGAEAYAASMSVGPSVTSVVLFLASWQAMALAMMLPTSVRFLALYRVVTSDGEDRFARRAGVCAGYALAWAWLGGVAALVGEALYRSTGVDVRLEAHSSLLAGGVLALAGAFQLTSLKSRCVSICGQPAAFLMRHYRRGIANAVELGLRYGLVCVGCCWALMGAMVVLGGGSIVAMGLLTAIMVAERALGWDRRFVKVVGAACIALGLLVALSPGAVPALASNAGGWVQMNSPMGSGLGWMAWCHG